MSSIVERLTDMGCDMQAAMERFMNDEEFYEDCYKMTMEDEVFENLGKSIEARNIQEAFDYAHMLKGVIANMGITHLYKLLVEIVEILRVKSMDNVPELYRKLMEEKKAYDALI